MCILYLYVFACDIGTLITCGTGNQVAGGQMLDIEFS